MNLKDHAKKFKLDAYELEVLKAYESGRLKPVPGQDALRAKLKLAAKNTLRKEQRVNIRMSTADLAGLKAKAEEEGIPYQTLISSVLHKFLNGRLVSKAA